MSIFLTYIIGIALTIIDLLHYFLQSSFTALLLSLLVHELEP